CSHFPLTDMGNRMRFVARYGHMFRWCPGLDWLKWDGRRWARLDDDGEVLRCAQETVAQIRYEAEALSGSDQDEVIEEKRSGDIMKSDLVAKWAMTSQASGHIRCIGPLAAAYLKVSVSDLDTDDWKLNVLNGTLHIRKTNDGSDYVLLQRHDPDDYITKLAPVSYDPDAPCEQYDKFFQRVQPKPEMRRHLHIVGGISGIGDTSYHAMWFFWGKGRNGKGTWLETLAHVLGDYADSVDMSTFMDSGRARGGGDATPDRIPLIGARSVRATEQKKKGTLDGAFIKAVTGGDEMTARDLNKPVIKFYPKFTLVMMGNYRPRIDETDEGLWGRLKLVPWGEYLPEAERDEALPKKLQAEASGILNRYLDGLRDFMDNGLCVPDEVRQATEEFRGDSDVLGMFMDQCTKTAIGAKVQSSSLFELFQAWAAFTAETGKWTQTKFSKELRERGYVKKHSDLVWWLDIETTKSVGDFGTYDQDGNFRVKKRQDGDGADPPAPDPDDPGFEGL
ncbi:MAG: phage/plasmid primase, P4 family, partial [Pseudomonadota bacterium]